MSTLRKPWAIFLLVSIVLSVYYQYVDKSGGLFAVISFGRVFAIGLALWLYRDTRAAGFLRWFFGASLLFAIGDTLAYNYQFFFGQDLPFPSAGEPFYLLYYPLILCGLMAMMRREGFTNARAYETFAVVILSTFLQWALVTGPLTDDSNSAVSVLYPLFDVLMIYCVARLFTVTRNNPALIMLVASALVLFMADCLYAWVTVRAGYSTPGDLDILWLVSYALMGAAALHPSIYTFKQQLGEGYELTSVLKPEDLE